MVQQSTGAPTIRVLVVDDSAFMRFTLSKYLNEATGISVVGTAKDGKEALEIIPKLNPDVVTLDVEMPHLDGLSTLREIMLRFPRPVIMISSLTSEGTIETVQALTIGAVDFIAKPAMKANMTVILDEISTKIRRASQAKVGASPRLLNQESPLVKRTPISQTSKKTRSLGRNEKVVVIGSSTGGPRALNTVIPALPADLPAAVVVIQHMPAGFTRSLAERLDSISPLQVKEAEPGDSLEVGRILLVPGGFHTVFDAQSKVTLNQNPPVHGVRPAVDVTMLSIAQQYGSRTVAAILTGMGSDGTNGCSLVHGSGGWVIAEAEETCVVWGMPRSVFEAGAANEIVPLPKVAEAIVRAARS